MKFAFSHNNLNVLDLDKSLRFYADALGLTERLGPHPAAKANGMLTRAWGPIRPGRRGEVPCDQVLRRVSGVNDGSKAYRLLSSIRANDRTSATPDQDMRSPRNDSNPWRVMKVAGRKVAFDSYFFERYLPRRKRRTPEAIPARLVKVGISNYLAAERMTMSSGQVGDRKKHLTFDSTACETPSFSLLFPCSLTILG